LIPLLFVPRAANPSPFTTLIYCAESNLIKLIDFYWQRAQEFQINPREQLVRFCFLRTERVSILRDESEYFLLF
jgi:hypothetical protein